MMQKTIPIAVMLALGASDGFAQLTTVFSDFDSTNIVTWRNRDNSVLTEGDFVTTDTDEELRFVSGNTGGFIQFGRSNGIGRTSSVITTLKDADLIELDYTILNTEYVQDFRLRLSLNTNAWTDGGGTFRTLATTTTLSASSNTVTGTLSIDISSVGNFDAMLDNYTSGGGSFFEFNLNNSGFPAINNAVTFYIDDFRAIDLDAVVTPIPEPSTAVTLFAVAAGALFVARRRNSKQKILS